MKEVAAVCSLEFGQSRRLLKRLLVLSFGLQRFKPCVPRARVRQSSRRPRGHAESVADGSSGQVRAPAPREGVPPTGGHDYPLTFSVGYPDRELDRLSGRLRKYSADL